MKRNGALQKPAGFTMAFTLIELLTVVVIIGILVAMLLPALARAKREARHVVCINNQKQVGGGLLTYASDNDMYYPDRSLSRPLHPDSFKGRLYPTNWGNYNRLQNIRQPRRTSDNRYWNLRIPLESYYSGAETMREIFVCPFTSTDYDRQFGPGVRTLGSTDRMGGFPGWKGSYATDPDAFYLGTYNLYFSYSYTRSTAGTIKRPMRKVGQRWENNEQGFNGTANAFSNIVISDKCGSNQFNYANSNHPTLFGPNIWKVSRYYGAGYMFSDGAGKGANYLKSSAAYMSDDMSVQLRKHISEATSIFNGGPFGGDKKSFIPIENFSDAP